MSMLGKKIREARKDRLITQGELSELIGVSDKSISAYESDRISPPIKVLEKIAEHTQKPISFFLVDSLDTDILAKLKDLEVEFKELKELLKERKRR